MYIEGQLEKGFPKGNIDRTMIIMGGNEKGMNWEGMDWKGNIDIQ